MGSLFGLLGGLLVVGGTRLPLATLPGLGEVSFFDYQSGRAAICLGVGAVLAVVFLARFFRLALLGSGLLAGLLTASGLDLQRSLHDLTAAGPETAELTGKVLRATHPEVGAALLAAGCGLCVLAGFVCVAPRGGRGAGGL